MERWNHTALQPNSSLMEAAASDLVTQSLVPVTRVPFQLAGLGPGHYYPDLTGFVLERGILLAFRRVALAQRQATPQRGTFRDLGTFTARIVHCMPLLISLCSPDRVFSLLKSFPLSSKHWSWGSFSNPLAYLLEWALGRRALRGLSSSPWLRRTTLLCKRTTLLCIRKQKFPPQTGLQLSD